MIRPLPNDPELGNLTALVDEEAMIARVSAHLERNNHIEIVGCVPRYIRYKPETSCLVRYDITFADASGSRTTVCAHLKSFSDDRAERRAESRKLDKMVVRVERRTSDLAYDQTTFIPDLNGLLQFFPVDYDLPFLVKAASAGDTTRRLRNAGPDFDMKIIVRPSLIRYKPGRKALFRYRLGTGPVAHLYGKIHADARGNRLRAQTAALIDAGIPTPPVVASLPDDGFITHAGFPGVQLASMRGTDGYTGWMAPLAHELHRFHQTTIPNATPHALAAEAARIRETTSLLGIIAPHLASRLAHIGDGITARLGGVEDVLATNHGDFYDDQAIVFGTGLNIIDLDELRLAHPLLDIGNLLAHLRSGELRGEPNGTAREAFLASALELNPYSEPDIALFEAISLIRLAPGPFRRLEADWPQGIERILGLAEHCLSVTRSHTVRAVVPGRFRKDHASAVLVPSPMPAGHNKTHASTQRISDDALPQLQPLQNPGTMSARFAGTPGIEPPAIGNIHVVRHKAGRRAILRYDLASGEQLFGKTFASERGPNVHEITRTITSARAFGPSVALPDPLAWIPDLKLLLQKSVPGTSIKTALLEGDLHLARRIATVLHHFHTSDLDLGRRHDLARELRPLEKRSVEVGELFPDLRGLANICRAQSLEQSPEKGPWRDRPVHRDFYHDQLLTHEGQLAVLDLDDAAMSEPAVDVANFAAHLTLLGIHNPIHASALDRVRAAFLEEYHQRDAGLDQYLLDFLTATTLLRLAGIHAPRHDGERIARELLLSAQQGFHAINGQHVVTARPNVI